MDPVDTQNSSKVGNAQPAPKPAPEREVRDTHATRPAPERPAPVQRQPVIAVRVGPAPEDNLRVDVEEALRKKLAQNSVLRRVGEVLSIESPTPGAKVEVELVGSGRTAAKVELELMGANAEAPPETASAPSAPAAPAPHVSTAALPAQGGLEARAKHSDVQRDEHVNELEPSRQQESQVRSTAVASHTGGIQNPDDPRRVELPNSRSEPAESAVAEAAFTQAGLVEASSEDQIVTRFFEGSQPENTGPEPRPEGKLGDRSVPFSTYA